MWTQKPSKGRYSLFPSDSRAPRTAPPPPILFLEGEETLNVPPKSLVPPANPGEQLPIHWQSTNYYLFNSCIFNTYKEHVQQGFAVVNNPWNDVFNKPHFKSRSGVEKWLDERPLYDCCNLFCRELKPPIIWHEWHHFFFLLTQRCTVSIFRDLI